MVVAISFSIIYITPYSGEPNATPANPLNGYAAHNFAKPYKILINTFKGFALLWQGWRMTVTYTKEPDLEGGALLKVH